MPFDTHTLAYRVLERMQQTFASYPQPHEPSEAQWNALADLVQHLEWQANGALGRKAYLSSLDPGVGKTTALVSFLDALLADDFHRDTGVLLCINTLAEIRKLVKETGIPAECLCIMTSDEPLNAMGSARPNEAQVLIVTHVRLERMLRDKVGFETQPALYFQGKPRAVRVWDEAWTPGRAISLDVDDVYGLLKNLRRISPEFRREIQQLAVKIEELSDGDLFNIPDFMTAYGLDLNRLLEPVAEYDPRDVAERSLRDSQVQALTDLRALSGKRIRVRRHRNGSDSLHFEDQVPFDMYPLIVLDASGRVRKFYSDLQDHRGIVHKLKSAPKSYRNLTVNVWQRGGGKGSWASNAQYLLRGIVEAIKTKPDEEWLVVAHREDQKRKIPNLEAELRRHFPGSEGRIHVITWGHHRAVNTYAHVSNIILAGTLFLRPGYYEANKHLATGVKVSQREFDKPERKVFEVGEHASDILQALCRGTVRRSQGDACAPCEAWVIASVRSGIPAALPRIFPDCTVEAWTPLEIRLNPTCQKAWGFVASWLETAKRGDTLRFVDIQKACGLDRKNFPRDVRNNPGFQQKLAHAGLIEDGNKRFTHYKLT